MSYTGVETARKLIDGESVPEKFVDMGVVVVNEETINQAEVQEVLSYNGADGL